MNFLVSPFPLTGYVVSGLSLKEIAGTLALCSTFPWKNYQFRAGNSPSTSGKSPRINISLGAFLNMYACFCGIQLSSEYQSGHNIIYITIYRSVGTSTGLITSQRRARICFSRHQITPKNRIQVRDYPHLTLS